MILRILLILLFLLTSASPAEAFGLASFLTSAVTTISNLVTGTVLGRVIFTAAVSIGLGLLSQLLTPKQKRGVEPVERGITQLIRASSEPHRIIWGERVVSGVLDFGEVSGSDNKYLHFVIPLAGHQVHEITTVFFNDVGVDDDEIDGSGNVVSGRFAGKLRIKKHLGLDDQAADSSLVSAAPDWTTAHRLQGTTYLYVRLQFDRNVYPTGVPNIKAMVKGRLVADPRDTAIVITSSSVADPTTILTASPHGLVAGNRAFISGHSGAIPEVIGEYQVLSAPTTTTFTIDVNVTTGGTGGSLLQMKWSDNAALCLRDYLLASFGLNVDQADEIDDVKSIAAATICDEEVDLPTALNPFNFTADASTDILTQTVASGIKPEPLHQTDGVELTTTGTLPTPLALATRYFSISVSGKEEPSIFRLATSIANAQAGTAINITDSGSGTHTLTRKSQTRYTVNGVISLGDDPIVLVPPLIFAMGGQLTYTQGKYTMFAGAFNGPATIPTLDESSLRDEIIVRPRPGKASIHNSVRGTFIDRDNKFLETDFPPRINTAFLTADKEEKIFKDIALFHVTDTHRAQRLAVLVNQRDRQGLVVDYPANLTVLEVAVGDVVDVTNDLLGWSDKEFEVLAWTFAEEGGIDLVLKETASGVYSFNPETDEDVLDIAPNTNLPGAFDAPPVPADLALASGTAQLLLQGDGTVVSRIQATWTVVDDVGVSSGGRIEVQMKKSTDSIWEDMPDAAGDATQVFLSPVEDGVNYDVRVRSVNRLKVTSETYATVSDHTVIGKTAVPANVTNFTAAQNGNAMNFRWTQVTDVDLAGYEIRYNPSPTTTWADATPLTEVTRGTAITNAHVSPGDWTFLIKAFDTSGNESTNAANVDAKMIAEDFDILLQEEQAPNWLGFIGGSGLSPLTNEADVILATEAAEDIDAEVFSFIKHYTGVLVPDSLNLASDDDWDTFDKFVPNPVANAIYQAPEFDIGFDDTIRVWGDIVSALGPGETVGIADPALEIDYRKDAESYDGFEVWTIGNIEARFIRFQLNLDTSKGLAKVTGFKPTVDLIERTEGAKGVTVAAGGQAITFAQQFHVVPLVTITVDSATALIATKENATMIGFTAHVFNTGGTDVGGTVDWQATGA